MLRRIGDGVGIAVGVPLGEILVELIVYNGLHVPFGVLVLARVVYVIGLLALTRYLTRASLLLFVPAIVGFYGDILVGVILAIWHDRRVARRARPIAADLPPAPPGALSPLA